MFFESQWGTGAVLSLFFPGAAEDPGTVEQMARYERNSASPNAMGEIIRLLIEIDARPILPTISVPTLVVHRTGDPIVPVQCGQDLAAKIPLARYVELAGEGHIPSGGPGLDDFADVEEFLTGRRSGPDPDRLLATVLFNDIVGSTSRAAELGDARWSELLDRHDVLMRTQIERFRGREIKATGEGFFAAFDGRPERSDVPWPRAKRPIPLVSASVPGSIPVSASSAAAILAELPCTSAPESVRSLSRARS